METLLNLLHSEEDKPTLQLLLSEELSLQLHSRLGEFSPLEEVEEEEPPTPRVQLHRATPGSTLELRPPALHLSTLEVAEEEPELELPLPAPPTCSASQGEPQTSRQPSVLANHLSSVEVLELELLLLEAGEAPCSASGPEGISPGQPRHRGGLPRLGELGSEEEGSLSASDVYIIILFPVSVLT